MPVKFRIPKLTDVEIASALAQIRDDLHKLIQLRINIQIPVSGTIEVSEKKPEQNKQLKHVFELNSQIASVFQLIAPDNQAVLRIARETEQITDLATVPDEWSQPRNQEYREKLPQIYASLVTSARSGLRAPDVEASF